MPRQRVQHQRRSIRGGGDATLAGDASDALLIWDEQGSYVENESWFGALEERRVYFRLNFSCLHVATEETLGSRCHQTWLQPQGVKRDQISSVVPEEKEINSVVI